MKRACVLAISISAGVFGGCDKDGDLGDTGGSSSAGDDGGEAGGDEAEGGEAEAEGGEAEGEGSASDPGVSSSASGDDGTTTGDAGETGDEDAQNPDVGGSVGESTGSGDPAYCDPLLQDCADGDTCVPLDGAFECAADESGATGSWGDPCDFLNACDPGLFCADGSDVACPAGLDTCCTWFCDVDAPAGICGGSECVAFFPEGEAPPGYEAVGYCNGG
jgi:hypothetical protein